MIGMAEVLGDLWDKGNGTGLDGWVGPGRGTYPIDDEAVHARERDLEAAIAALTAAGFGPVKEAAAKALEDAAQEFTERVAVTRKMTPDDGTPYATATRNNAYGMQIAAIALRARAAAVRGEG